MSEERDLNEELDTNSLENEHVENAHEETAPEITLEDKLNEQNDKYLRLYSEFDNYRKRTNKEKIDLIATANAELLKSLISTLDDFERAIANNEQVTDVATLKEGFSLIYAKFKSTLESKGLTAIEAKGKDFDSDFHEAIANIPAPSSDLVGKIVDDVEKGYMLNDKVVRYSKVVVGQ